MSFVYCACYCEENVWHLCHHELVADKEAFAVFISNERRACPMFCQRAAASPGEPVWWDYHVILLAGDGAAWQVWDLDSMMGMPAGVDEYLRQTFPFSTQVDAVFAPEFRVISRDKFVARFSSDRSHMKDKNGNWLAPPPDWPTIQSSNPITLAEFLDYSSKTTTPFISLGDLKAKFAASTT